MTNASNAHLTSEKPVGPRLLRGANINYYVLLSEPKQGEPLYLREKEFLSEYSQDIRATHNRAPRIGFQESCPIDNWRRLIACRIPEGFYCVHKIRYFTGDAKYDLMTLLALFNSKACDWRFSLTSTNNSVNQYEVDALPIPRFQRLTASPLPAVDWKTWDGKLRESVTAWEVAVLEAMRNTPGDAACWPDTIHDALAAAGKEMTRLGERRQSLTNEFSDWLVEQLEIDEERFSGMTYLRGGQADFDRRDWNWFVDLLHRNRRACGVEPDRKLSAIQKRFAEVVADLVTARDRFEALDAAIDRIVWQLLGLNPDGSVPASEVHRDQPRGRGERRGLPG